MLVELYQSALGSYGIVYVLPVYVLTLLYNEQCCMKLPALRACAAALFRQNVCAF